MFGRAKLRAVEAERDYYRSQLQSCRSQRVQQARHLEEAIERQEVEYDSLLLDCGEVYRFFEDTELLGAVHAIDRIERALCRPRVVEGTTKSAIEAGGSDDYGMRP